MSVSNEVVKAIYAGDGSTVTFAVPFSHASNTTVRVVLRDESSDPATETLQVVSTKYTLTGDPATAVVMTTAPTSDQKLLVVRLSPVTQAASFSASGSFPSTTNETALDNAVRQSQENKEKLSRAVLFRESSAQTSPQYAAPVADEFLKWTDSADGVESAPLTTTDAAAASQSEAETATENTKFMSALRSAQQRTAFIASEAEAIALTDNSKLLTPLRGSQMVNSVLGAQASKTATYLATLNDTIIYCDTSGGAFEIDLPSAVSGANKTFIIQYTDTGFANALTVDPNLTDTINSAATITLNTERETVELISDGVSNWVIVRREIPTIQTAYTPTFQGFGTATGASFKWSRDGIFAYIEGGFSSGTSSAAEAQATLPSGLTVLTGDQLRVVGHLVMSENFAGEHAILSTGGDAFLNFSKGGGSNQSAAIANGNVIVGTGVFMSFRAKVPITGWEV